MELKGVIDRLEPTIVGGWVLDVSRPQRRLEIELLIDGEVAGIHLADRHRADLAQAGLGDGRCAFRIDLGDAVASERVAVRVLGTEFEVPVDRRVVRAGHRRPAPPPTLQGQRYGRCVLHIGLEKTGTTSLQRFFGLNRAALLARGWHVPESLAPHGGQGILNHILLTTTAMRDEHLADDLRQANGVTSPEALQAHRKAVSEALQAELAPLDKTDATLLLSNEHLHSRLRSPAELQRLRDFLLGFAEEVQVVIYLRPQHEVAASLFSTAIQNGFHGIRPLPNFQDGSRSFVDRAFFDYAALLSRWSEAFGREALDVRLYEREQMIGADMIEDFCFRAGIEMAGLRPLDERQNVSLSARAERVLLALNPLLAELPPDEARRVRMQVERLFKAVDPRGLKGIRPSRRDAQHFQDAFAPINEAVRRAWMPTRDTLFETDFAKFPEVEDPLDLSPEEAAGFILMLLRGEAEDRAGRARS